VLEIAVGRTVQRSSGGWDLRRGPGSSGTPRSARPGRGFPLPLPSCPIWLTLPFGKSWLHAWSG